MNVHGTTSHINMLHDGPDLSWKDLVCMVEKRGEKGRPKEMSEEKEGGNQHSVLSVKAT